MTRRKDCKSSSKVNRTSGRRVVSNQVQRVLRELQAAACESSRKTDPFVEQLKQCPEAITAGEMIGKMLDSLKYGPGHDQAGHRHLPPAGTVVPPLV
jgi:hypothetical protein